jgi:MFS transporter, FSR family, fosmidomycin resistance protein
MIVAMAASTAAAAVDPETCALDGTGIWLLSLAHVVSDANQSALPALIPWLVSHRGLSLTAAATLVLAMNLSSSVVQPLFGHLSDRRSLAGMIPVALLLATFGTAIIGFAPTMPWMLLGALVSGIGVAAFHPEGSRFANYFAGARRATGMSIFTTGGYLGFALGPILVTPLLLLFGLHGTAFLLLPGLVLAGLIWRDLPRYERARATVHRARYHRTGIDDWRGFGIMAGVVALRSVVFFAGVTFTTIFAIDVTHVGKAPAAVALAAQLLGGAFGTLLGGRLADRLDRRRVVSLSLLLTAACGAAIVTAGILLPAFWLFVPLAICFGIALGLSAGVVVVMGQEYLPQRIGIAAGVTLGLSVTIGGLAAPLFGWIGDGYGLVPVFATSTGFSIVSLMASFFMPTPAHLRRL